MSFYNESFGQPICPTSTVALAECCIAGGSGADVHLHDDLLAVSSLFSESQSRIVVTCGEHDADALVEMLVAAGVPCSVIGAVGGDKLAICQRFGLRVDDLRGAFEPTIEALVRGEAQSEELRVG